MFTTQVRERLRVALERVSMLEDQLAASSQEVKFDGVNVWSEGGTFILPCDYPFCLLFPR